MIQFLTEELHAIVEQLKQMTEKVDAMTAGERR